MVRSLEACRVSYFKLLPGILSKMAEYYTTPDQLKEAAFGLGEGGVRAVLPVPAVYSEGSRICPAFLFLKFKSDRGQGTNRVC